jgi:protein-tyrosine phosphatase
MPTDALSLWDHEHPIEVDAPEVTRLALPAFDAEEEERAGILGEGFEGAEEVDPWEEYPLLKQALRGKSDTPVRSDHRKAYESVTKPKPPKSKSSKSDEDWWLKYPGLAGPTSGYLQPSGPPKTSESHPIGVDYFTAENTGTRGQLGMTFAPGKAQSWGFSGAHDRNLTKDLERLHSVHGCTVLVPLIEDCELKSLDIPKLFDGLIAQGMGWIRFPYQDMRAPPSIHDTYELVKSILAYMRKGHNVVIHCKGGLGRTGTIAACVLLYLGYEEKDAIYLTRKTRKGTIQNYEQEYFIHYFAEYLAAKR